MTPASLAYYFKRKEMLAATCVIFTMSRMMREVDRAEEAATPELRLAAFIQGMFELRRRVLLGEESALANLNELRMIVEPCRARVMTVFWNLVDRIQSLFDAPELAWIDEAGRAMRARLVLEQVMWAPAWLENYTEADYARAGARLADILIFGLAAEGQSWSTRRTPALRVITPVPGVITRDAYLLAATELINERGVAGASVDKIAARLNVTKGSFYHHNERKSALVVACFDRSMEIMQTAQREASEGNAWQRLSRTCATLIDGHASGQARLLRNYALSTLPMTVQAEIIQRMQACAQRFAAVIGDGVADGSLRAVDPVIAAQSLLATINAAAYARYWNRGTKVDDILGAYARPALMGVLTRA